MRQLPLSLACVPNPDRTSPLLDGRVQPAGIEFTPRVAIAPPGDLFRRIAQDAEFDVSEMSVSTYMVMHSRGDDRYVGLPIFPSRAFRHGFIFVNTGAGIERPEDLRGRRMGATEYQQTAALWIRGLLQDDYGVRPQDVEWFEGGLESYRPERLAVEMAGPVRVQRIGPEQTLDAMLQAGEIDALLGASQPPSFQRGVPQVQRLFPDHRAVEREYFQRTRFFPMMHMVVVRRAIYEQHPWVARAIYDAFQQVKEYARARLGALASLGASLPWIAADLEELRTIFDGDAWPYGLAKNRHALEYLARRSHQEGLSARRLAVEELMAQETWDT
jgi:4,5-dihydroxyphthalate decarboxylase